MESVTVYSMVLSYHLDDKLTITLISMLVIFQDFGVTVDMSGQSREVAFWGLLGSHTL